MKIKDILKIQSIIDKRAIPSNVLEFLEDTYYSKSKDEEIKYGDLHIIHFINIFINNDNVVEMVKTDAQLERDNEKKITITDLIQLLKSKLL